MAPPRRPTVGVAVVRPPVGAAAGFTTLRTTTSQDLLVLACPRCRRRVPMVDRTLVRGAARATEREWLRRSHRTRDPSSTVAGVSGLRSRRRTSPSESRRDHDRSQHGCLHLDRAPCSGTERSLPIPNEVGGLPLNQRTLAPIGPKAQEGRSRVSDPNGFGVQVGSTPRMPGSPSEPPGPTPRDSRQADR